MTISDGTSSVDLIHASPMQNYDPYDFEDEEYKTARTHYQPNVKAMLRPRHMETVNSLR